MAPSPSTTCPFCALPHALKPHCGLEHPTCRWVRCSSCRVVFNPATGRGFDRDNKLRQVPDSA